MLTATKSSCLRAIAAKTGRHFKGLARAVREVLELRELQGDDRRWRRKLANFDIAGGYARHIDVALMHETIGKVRHFLRCGDIDESAAASFPRDESAAAHDHGCEATDASTDEPDDAATEPSSEQWLMVRRAAMEYYIGDGTEASLPDRCFSFASGAGDFAVPEPERNTRHRCRREKGGTDGGIRQAT